MHFINRLPSYLQQLRTAFSSGPGHASIPQLPCRKRDRPAPPKPTATAQANAHTVVQPTAIPRKEAKASEQKTKLQPGISFIMLDKLRSSTKSSYTNCVSGFLKMLQVLTEHAPEYNDLSQKLVSELIVSLFYGFHCLFLLGLCVFFVKRIQILLSEGQLTLASRIGGSSRNTSQN